MSQVHTDTVSSVNPTVQRMLYMGQKLGLRTLTLETPTGAQVHGDEWKNLLSRVLVPINFLASIEYEEAYTYYMNPIPKALRHMTKLEYTKSYGYKLLPYASHVNYNNGLGMLPFCFNHRAAYEVGEKVVVAAESEICHNLVHSVTNERHAPRPLPTSVVITMDRGRECVCTFSTEFVITKVIPSPANSDSIYWNFYEVVCTLDEFKHQKFIVPAGLLCRPLELIPHLI